MDGDILASLILAGVFFVISFLLGGLVLVIINFLFGVWLFTLIQLIAFTGGLSLALGFVIK